MVGVVDSRAGLSVSPLTHMRPCANYSKKVVPNGWGGGIESRSMKR